MPSQISPLTHADLDYARRLPAMYSIAAGVADRFGHVRVRSVGAGAVIAAVVVLFWIGPGNLFPIVIASAAAILFMSSITGASAAYAFKRLRAGARR